MLGVYTVPASFRYVVSWRYFNNVLRPTEREGGQVPLPAEYEPFADCLTECSLEDMKARGRVFTWTNNSIRSKIDRVLINDMWMHNYPYAEVEFQAELLSDHTRSVIQLTHEIRKRRPQFRYCNMWSQDVEFLPLVKRVWMLKVQGNIMYQLATKLRMLSKALKPLKTKFSEAIN